MACKRKYPRRKTTCSQKRRFPIGELSKQKAILRDEYLSKSVELCSLKKRIRRLQEKSDQVEECINSLDIIIIIIIPLCKGSFEKGALAKEDRSTKHPNLENEAPKTRKRSTQKLDTGLSFINTRPMLIQQESSTITNRMQFKSTQVVNAFPPLRGRPGGRPCFGRDQKTENAQTISRMLLYCQ